MMLGLVSVAAQDDSGADLVIWADENVAPVLDGVKDSFAEDFGITVEIQQIDFGNLRTQFAVAAPAGEGPDILIGAHDWLGEFVSNGLVLPVDLGDKADQFVQVGLDALTFDGQLYGMPFQTENVALFRNVDLVPEPVETLDEMIEIAEQLQAEGLVQQGYVLQQADPFHFFGIQTAFGGGVFGQDEAGNYLPDELLIDSEGSIAAAEWLDEQVKAGNLVGGIDGDAATAMFAGGDAAFFITGPWNLQNFRDAGVNYAIDPIPAGDAGPGRPFSGVRGFFVSAFSDDPLLAQTFLTEVVATDGVMSQIVSNRASAFIPTLENQDDPDLAAFAIAGENALPMPAIPEMGNVWAAWSDAITLVFNQDATPEEAFTNAAEQIRTLIAEGSGE